MPDIKSNENYEGWSKSMTDYQFKHIMELKDKVTSLEQKNDALYRLVKESTLAGKTPEETLAALDSFMES